MSNICSVTTNVPIPETQYVLVRGLEGRRGPTGPRGPRGPRGEAYTTGTTGATGPTGPTGPHGRNVLLAAGSSNPASAPMPDSTSLFLNTHTGDVWFSQGHVWTISGNIKGPTGVTGDTGPQGIQGVTGPQGDSPKIYSNHGPPNFAASIANSLYLDTSNGSLYQYVNHAWTFLLSLGTTGPTGITGPTGPKGKHGPPGSQIFTGQGPPLISPCEGKGHIYIDTCSGALYQYTNCTWSMVGNMKGPKGPRGPRGYPGVSGRDCEIRYEKCDTPCKRKVIHKESLSCEKDSESESFSEIECSDTETSEKSCDYPVLKTKNYFTQNNKIYSVCGTFNVNSSMQIGHFNYCSTFCGEAILTLSLYGKYIWDGGSIDGYPNPRFSVTLSGYKPYNFVVNEYGNASLPYEWSRTFVVPIMLEKNLSYTFSVGIVSSPGMNVLFDTTAGDFISLSIVI